MSLLEFKKVVFPGPLFSGCPPFDLALEAGECLVLFGRAGVGKELVLKLAAGILAPEAGEVLTRDARGKGPVPAGYISHKGGLLNNMSLLQNSMLPAVFHGALSLRAAEKRAKAVFDELGIAGLAARLPSMVTASGRMLAQVARALVAEPALIVADQPLSDIDPETARTVRRLLARLKADGRTGLLVSAGNIGPFLGLGDRFLLARRGRLDIFEGKAGLSASADPEVRSFLTEE
ncbi:MAG TPA: ATP-binding cassette domain-containing protein [Elusimicrobiales bacterium]|nr:ATP-binding cassette domain-containing protein [Elusimicrobiales bacterium]